MKNRTIFVIGLVTALTACNSPEGQNKTVKHPEPKVCCKPVPYTKWESTKEPIDKTIAIKNIYGNGDGQITVYQKKTVLGFYERTTEDGVYNKNYDKYGVTKVKLEVYVDGPKENDRYFQFEEDQETETKVNLELPKAPEAFLESMDDVDWTTREVPFDKQEFTNEVNDYIYHSARKCQGYAWGLTRFGSLYYPKDLKLSLVFQDLVSIQGAWGFGQLVLRYNSKEDSEYEFAYLAQFYSLVNAEQIFTGDSNVEFADREDYQLVTALRVPEDEEDVIIDSKISWDEDQFFVDLEIFRKACNRVYQEVPIQVEKNDPDYELTEFKDLSFMNYELIEDLEDLELEDMSTYIYVFERNWVSEKQKLPYRIKSTKGFNLTSIGNNELNFNGHELPKVDKEKDPIWKMVVE